MRKGTIPSEILCLRPFTPLKFFYGTITLHVVYAMCALLVEPPVLTVYPNLTTNQPITSLITSLIKKSLNTPIMPIQGSIAIDYEAVANNLNPQSTIINIDS